MVSVVAANAQAAPSAAVDLATDVKSLKQRYAATVSMPEPQRRTQLRFLAEAEHRLPGDRLRAVSRARMQALLEMDAELDAGVVERLVASLEAVMDSLPGALAMRRVEYVQTLSREFSAADQERLRRLVPGVLKLRPANLPLAGPVVSKGRHWWQRRPG